MNRPLVACSYNFVHYCILTCAFFSNSMYKNLPPKQKEKKRKEEDNSQFETDDTSEIGFLSVKTQKYK